MERLTALQQVGRIGDAKLGVQTQSSERIPIAASLVIVAAGTACLIFGSRKQ